MGRLISLPEYICMNPIEKYLRYSLFNHFNIEFANTNMEDVDNQIYEKYGLSIDIEKLSKDIAEIFNNLSFGINEITIDSDWINKLIINKTSINICSYDCDKSNFENKEFYIKIGDKMKNKLTLIIHELTHAYEDYNRYIKGYKTLKDLIDSRYGNYISNIAKPFPDIEGAISTLKYFCNDQERNAYFAQLKPTIQQILKNKKYNRKNFNYISFVNELQNTDIWKYIFDAGRVLMNFDLYDNKTYLVDCYNKLCNKHYTYNQMKKDLEKLWMKFKRKFEVLVPKIVNDEINNE
jgi:hypothetical protein